MAQHFPQFAGAADPAAILMLAQVRSALLAAAAVLGRATAASFSAKGSELEAAVSAGDIDAALAALLTDKQTPRKFNEKLASTPEVRAAQALAQEILAARCQHEAHAHHERMVRLARVLLAEFAALKRERGWIDMNDIERAALELLSHPVLSGWVQERLDTQVRHLLVDEFQDTNPMQWQALGQWLQSYAGAGGSAPAVFIVGDPKQSIYRFRRAEPQVFRAAQQFIVQELGGDRLSCDHTRRNAPDVLDVVNQVFDAAQRGYEYEGFRLHTTESSQAGSAACLPQVLREPKAAPDEPLQPAWRDSLAVPRETPEERLVTRECRQAAAWIAHEIAAGAPPGHFMVLARKRDRLVEMEQELRALHIPAQQPENTDLCAAPEVQDITALLDVLVTTSHDLSLARALKSPLFNVSDDALVSLRRVGSADPTSWFDLITKSDVLPAAREKLLRWKAWLDQLPPHDALEAIYADGGVLARFAAAAPAPLRAVVLANLRALLGAALQVDGGRYLTPYGFVRALKAGGIEGPAVAAEGVVRLLTVHGAKGLEAPTVLLLDADGAPPPAETMGVLCEWPGEAPAPWRFAFIASETRPPPCSEDALRVEQEARRREELNGLYVALTRAERRLVISSVQPHRRTATSWWERLEPLMPALPAPPAATPIASKASAPVVLQELPQLAVAAAAQVQQAQDDDDDETSRFGKAVHRLLEFATARTGGFPASRLRRVAREFALRESQMEHAVVVAERILAGEGAWAWDRSAIDWHGNEIELLHQGQRLRIDRLVRRTDGEWWVLDYKTAFAPEAQPELQAQLARYRAAVQAANPGAVVRAAFLTGQGRVVEVA